MSKQHWSRGLLFLSITTFIGIAIVLVLMFLLYDFAIYLYDEAIILIDTLWEIMR